MDKLKELFNDPETGFTNLRTFFMKVKAKNPNIKYKDVEDFYNKQEIVQVMRPQIKPREFNSVTADYPKDVFEVDFMIFDRYTIDGYKYIFCCVDVYSRYAQAIATTNLTMETILKAMKSIFTAMGYPNRLKADNQFAKKEFIDLCDAHGVKCVFSDPYEINKNPIVERFNRTLALRLQKIRIATNNKKWYTYLNTAVNNYNNTFHSTIKNTPASVFNGKEFNEQEVHRVPVSFKVGDVVRIVVRKKTFQKGDMIQYSPQVYRIVEVKGNRFKLGGDSEKLYKDYELKKVSDIVYRPDSEQLKQQNEQIAELIKSTKVQKPEVDTKNIIEGKRTRREVNYRE
jgi:hypothetical protein